MGLLKKYYAVIQQWFYRISEKKYFNEIYVGIIAFISLLGWRFNSIAGMSVLLSVSVIAVLFTFDLKYTIPSIMYLVFTLGEGLSSYSVSVPFVILGILMFVFILIPTLKNGIHRHKMKSLLGLAGLAVMNFIPILWCDTIPAGSEVFYFFFFADAGYFIIYFLYVNGLGKNSIRMLAVSMSYLGVMLAVQCFCMIYKWKDTVESILDLWYYMGWGLCNEAGIMICVSLPFTFYLLAKSTRLEDMILQNAKILITAAGLIFTNSRGSYLFGFIEIVLLVISLFFIAEKKKAYRNTMFGYAVLLLVLCIIFHDDLLRIVDKVIGTVFEHGFSDNGRFQIWEKAVDAWGKNFLYKLFGPGFCSVIEWRNTAAGEQLTPLVFHSTIYQTLAMGGIVGLFFLFIHFYQKYKQIFSTERAFLLTVGIGYLIVDIYGLIDNTYHMYYYMIPLMIIMACIDCQTTAVPDTPQELW